MNGVSVQAQRAILDIVELEFKVVPPESRTSRWTYLPTTMKKALRMPHLRNGVPRRAIIELMKLGYLDEKGLLTKQGRRFYFTLAQT